MSSQRKTGYEVSMLGRNAPVSNLKYWSVWCYDCCRYVSAATTEPDRCVGRHTIEQHRSSNFNEPILTEFTPEDLTSGEIVEAKINVVP